MIFAVAIGVLSAIVLLIVMARLGIRKFMGYPAFMDAAGTVLLAVLLHGSYVGMVAAIVGGMFLSLMITIIRKTYGYSKLTRKGWVTYEGTWTTKLHQSINERKLSCWNLNSSMVLPASIVLAFVFLLSL